MTDKERIAALVAENAELRRRMQEARLKLSTSSTVRPILDATAVPAGTTLATREAENKDLNRRIAEAISKLAATSAARLILDIPALTGTFSLIGAVGIRLKAAPLPPPPPVPPPAPAPVKPKKPGRKR